MSTKKKATIDLKARELKDLVTPVLPLADNGRGFTPLLASVRIESSGKYLTATATDRFRLGIKRLAPESKPIAGIDAVVPVTALRSMLAMFKPTRTLDPDLTLTFDSESVTVTTGAVLDGFLNASVSWMLTHGDYPPVAKLVRHALTQDIDAAATALNPSFLGDFKHAQQGGEPLVLRFGKKVVGVQVGADFVGAVSTVRYAPDAAALDEVWQKILPESKPEAVAAAS